jgi:hypothetical protein
MRFSVSNRSTRRELNASVTIQNEANKAAKVESKKPRWMQRAEANTVRRELKRDAMMTAEHRSYAMKLTQAALVITRAQLSTRKRFDEIRKGLSGKESKTDLGIILPSGAQVHKVSSGASGKAV